MYVCVLCVYTVCVCVCVCILCVCVCCVCVYCVCVCCVCVCCVCTLYIIVCQLVLAGKDRYLYIIITLMENVRKMSDNHISYNTFEKQAVAL